MGPMLEDTRLRRQPSTSTSTSTSRELFRLHRHPSNVITELCLPPRHASTSHGQSLPPRRVSIKEQFLLRRQVSIKEQSLRHHLPNTVHTTAAPPLLRTSAQSLQHPRSRTDHTPALCHPLPRSSNTRVLPRQLHQYSIVHMIVAPRPRRTNSSWRVEARHLHHRSFRISTMTRKKTRDLLLHRRRIALPTTQTEQSRQHHLPKTASLPPNRLPRILRNSLLRPSRTP